jgi:hypothetical protein
MLGIDEIEEKLKYKMNDTGPCNMDISVKISAICFSVFLFWEWYQCGRGF